MDNFSFVHEIPVSQWIMTYPDYFEQREMFLGSRPFFRDMSGVGVEVGTFEGYNALSIVKYLNITKLYCVDPYLKYDCLIGEYMSTFSQEEWDEIYERTKIKLQDYPTEIIRKESVRAVDSVPNDLDWVYIDGNHEAESVFNDLTAWYPKVKVGGRIGGHDATEVEVKIGLTQWADANKINRDSIKFEWNDWWITKM